MIGTHFVVSRPLYQLPPMATIVAALQTVEKLKWKLIHLSWYGIIAHTHKEQNGKVQEIVIRWENDNLMVRSDNTRMDLLGRSKNKRNVERFLDHFDVYSHTITEEDAFEILQTQNLQFAHPYRDILAPQRFAQIGRRENPLNIFIPVKGYFVTPILLIANIVVFILMTVAGADILKPATSIIYRWGGNYGPAIADGEWWRLITATFVHIGIVHLLSNMFALGFIGYALEPLLGRLRFTTAYLLSGLTGSLMSVYIHPHIISAGASGAIFGMFGVFLTVLSTRLTESKTRSIALPSMILYVLYQLAAGMKDGVDNAGHIGGLLGGIIIGYALYPSLKKPQSNHIKYNTLAALYLGAIVLTLWVIAQLR